MSEVLVVPKLNSSDIWHSRLGHPNLRSLEVPSNNKCINIICWNKTPIICVSFQMEKGCKLPLQLRNKIENETSLKVHCNLWEPALVESSQHMKYYALFVDDPVYTHGYIHLKENLIFLKLLLNFKNWLKSSFQNVSRSSSVMVVVN